jgi:RNA polymerase sigma factor (sigma-70 family)
MVVQRLRARQPAVLDDLLAAYGREIQAVAYLIVRDRGAAEDVVVETLVAALENGAALRNDEALRPWLLRIATNRAVSMRRKTTRLVQLEAAEEPASPAEDSDTRIALLEGIDTLPPRMRAAIVLRYYADLSVDECARALARSPNTIKAQLQEALDRLRSCLSDSDRQGRQAAGEAENA